MVTYFKFLNGNPEVQPGRAFETLEEVAQTAFFAPGRPHGDGLYTARTDGISIV